MLWYNHDLNKKYCVYFLLGLSNHSLPHRLNTLEYLISVHGKLHNASQKDNLMMNSGFWALLLMLKMCMEWLLLIWPVHSDTLDALEFEFSRQKSTNTTHIPILSFLCENWNEYFCIFQFLGSKSQKNETRFIRPIIMFSKDKNPNIVSWWHHQRS